MTDKNAYNSEGISKPFYISRSKKNIDVWRLNGIIFSFLLIILSHKCGVKIKYGFLARCHTHERKNGLKKSQKYVEIFSEQHVANKYCM